MTLRRYAAFALHKEQVATCLYKKNAANNLYICRAMEMIPSKPTDKTIIHKGKPYVFSRMPLERYTEIAHLLAETATDGISEATTLFRLQQSLAQGVYEILGIDCQETGTLVGVVGVWHLWRRYSGKSAEIDHTYLHKDLRGAGLGTLFLDWIDGYLKSSSYDAVELNAYLQNSAAHKFYLNRGFRILGLHQVKKYEQWDIA